MATYRGFNIIPADGGFTLVERAAAYRIDPYTFSPEVFPSEERAMDHIDAVRRAARLANPALSPFA